MSDTRNRLEYTRPERQRKAIAERIIDNPDSKPAELLEALKILERLSTKAERRTRDRAEEPADPTVDDLVSALEKGQKTEKQPLQHIAAQGLNGPEKAEKTFVPIEAICGPTDTAKALEVIQAIADGKTPLPAVLVPEVSALKCWNCDQSGQPTWDDRILCPTHFASEAARNARQNAAASLARQQGDDWAVDFATQRQMNTSGFEKSRAIWAEQDRENADRRDQQAAERAEAEAQYNRARADYIQRGGRL